MTKYLSMQKRHRMILLALLMVLFVTLTGFAWSNKTVTVVADGQTYTVKTHLNSAKGVVHEAGITLGAKDAIQVNTLKLENGSVVTVVRAIPVHVTANGQTKLVLTAKRTAPEVADELGYQAPNYVTLEDDNEILKPNSSITIARVASSKETTELKQVEVDTIIEKDDRMAKGQEDIVTQGTPGEERVTARIYYDESGKIIKRQQLKVDTLTAMVPTVKKVGTRDTVTTSRGDMRYREVLTMEATAYIPSDGNGDGITASGMVAQRGVVAVDPNVIPLGTRLYIPGYGMAVAGDTGGAIKGHRIDLLVDTYSEAINFGRQNVEVYVLQ